VTDDAVATWKELCLDTTGGEALGQFWASALHLTFRPDAEDGDVVGPTEGHGIAICRVPEPISVKHRVHLDVFCGSVDELVQLGASVQLPAAESGYPWTVMTDPEGGEFCAFVRTDLPDYRMFQVVVDAVDAGASARWWADLLGATAHRGDSEAWWRVREVPGLPFERLTFQQVPEPKTAKNRIHWDVYGRVDDVLAAGATLLRSRDEEISWDVLADPEGNEFCVFEPRPR
jgi:hypothetical protein